MLNFLAAIPTTLSNKGESKRNATASICANCFTEWSIAQNSCESKRSCGLLQFAQHYRDLAGITHFRIGDLRNRHLTDETF